MIINFNRLPALSTLHAVFEGVQPQKAPQSETYPTEPFQRTRRHRRAAPVPSVAEPDYFFRFFTALSPATTPEIMAQEFIMAVRLSEPLAPPTTQPAPKRLPMG